MSLKKLLPTSRVLNEILCLSRTRTVDDCLAQVLFKPLKDFLSRPSKHFRGQLVELGFDLSGVKQNALKLKRKQFYCQLGATFVEALHAASLVVDDIQDGSHFRRGKRTLHQLYGLPVALNAGNWLYFWPFEILRNSRLEPKCELELHRLAHRVLLKAHCGQAMDVGVSVDRIPQQRIPSICRATLELKTGSLTSLALGVGAILGRASRVRRQELESFGRSFGLALQMFDDLGNLTVKDSKRYEDLRLKRPSWVWSMVASEFTESEFQKFRRAVAKLPDDSALSHWLSDFGLLHRASRSAIGELSQALSHLSKVLSQEERGSSSYRKVKNLTRKLRVSYG